MSLEKNPANDIFNVFIAESIKEIVEQMKQLDNFKAYSAMPLDGDHGAEEYKNLYKTWLADCEKLYQPWKENLRNNGFHTDLINVVLKNHVTETIETLSEGIPEEKALKNDFFNKWLSDEELDFKTLRKIFVNYATLTDLTRHAVALSYLVAHGDINAEVKISQNLDEENGRGVMSNAHFKLLLNSAIAVLEIAKGSKLTKEEADLIGESNEHLLLDSTRKATIEEQTLYTGQRVNSVGVLKSLLVGRHPIAVRAGVAAVAAAHEGKATGMLMKLLEGAVKYHKKGEEDQKDNLREYFKEHLGKDLVFKIVKRKPNEEKYSDKIAEENKSVKGMSSKQLRKMDLVEQAHRKDSNDNAVSTIMAGNFIFDKLICFIVAEKSMKEFLESHGRFWDSLARAIFVEKTNSITSVSISEPVGGFVAQELKKRGRRSNNSVSGYESSSDSEENTRSTSTGSSPKEKGFLDHYKSRSSFDSNAKSSESGSRDITPPKERVSNIRTFTSSKSSKISRSSSIPQRSESDDLRRSSSLGSVPKGEWNALRPSIDMCTKARGEGDGGWGQTEERKRLENSSERGSGH